MIWFGLSLFIITASAVGFVGNFSAVIEDNINLKNCQATVNSDSLYGYQILNNQTQESYCCLQLGLSQGDSCLIGTCSSMPVIFNTFADTDTSNCFVNCVDSQAVVNASVITSANTFSGIPQAALTQPTYDSYIVLKATYVPNYKVHTPTKVYACLQQGSYSESRCHFSNVCNDAVSLTTGFFVYNSTCYTYCYPTLGN